MRQYSIRNIMQGDYIIIHANRVEDEGKKGRKSSFSHFFDLLPQVDRTSAKVSPFIDLFLFWRQAISKYEHSYLFMDLRILSLLLLIFMSPFDLSAAPSHS